MHILVTGGAGFIGTHTLVELTKHGHTAVIVDNFSNSSPIAIERVQEITGQQFTLQNVDCNNKGALSKVFESEKFDAVIHFAGLKSVGESVKNPLYYYHQNIGMTLTLLEVMASHKVKNLIFSSSATVYGIPQELPLKETSPVGQNIPNPYGQTKYMIEQILRDLVVSDSTWAITALRYFNPVGAHHSGKIGEDPKDIPNNLLPYITQVAVGKLPKLRVFGDDQDTLDGTGVRDYIHVVDLAKGHVAALEHLRATGQMEVYNLGAGSGVSVLQMIHAFEAATGQQVPYEVVARRPGDVESCYANVDRAKTELGWQVEKTIEDVCRDAWNWQSQNPSGYER